VGEEKKTCEHVRQLLEQRGGGEGGQPLLLSLLSWLLTTLSLQYPDKQVQNTKNCGRDSLFYFRLTEAKKAFEKSFYENALLKGTGSRERIKIFLSKMDVYKYKYRMNC
jgi:hypothetical protein